MDLTVKGSHTAAMRSLVSVLLIRAACECDTVLLCIVQFCIFTILQQSDNYFCSGVVGLSYVGFQLVFLRVF